MIIKDRKGDWVIRIYSRNPDGSWSVGTEQYFPTRALMRAQVKHWKSALNYKIKTYRIGLTVTGCSESVGFFNTTMYVETR